MNFSTPLKQFSSLGSAKKGSDHWLMQRITAAALVVLGLWLAVAFALLPDYGYATLVAWIRHPASTILLMLVVLVASYHSHLGVQVVLQDYIHAPGAKVVSLVLATFVHFAVAITGIYSIAKIAFGPSI